MASCRRFDAQTIRLAASRTFWMAGSSRAIRMAMIAITTSNSMSVNPCRHLVFCMNRFSNAPPDELMTTTLYDDVTTLYDGVQGGVRVFLQFPGQLTPGPFAIARLASTARVCLVSLVPSLRAGKGQPV